MVRKWCNPGFKRIKRMSYPQILLWLGALQQFSGEPTWLRPIIKKMKDRRWEILMKKHKIN